ncbi:MAG TPA: sugar transferase [Solirubrobacterales bacterium]|nr:sugar transferase [Solirubrobacterales bacterium]
MSGGRLITGASRIGLRVAARARRQIPHPALERFHARDVCKRVGDVLCVILLLPVILPVGLMISAAIFADSPGPIFYRSTRIGRGGRPFQMLKFRKMLRDAAGSSLTVANDDRFTPIGRFLAASRLDELPQLWNVLKGEMRLVGPRPETVDFVASHPLEYEEILTITPGITGPSQVQHFNEGVLLEGIDDPVRHYLEQILPYKVELDIQYVREWTVWGDFKLLLSTFALPFRVFAIKAGELVHLPPGRRRAGWVVSCAAVLLLIAFSAGGGSAR